MENIEQIVRIDNDRDELADYLDATLAVVNFKQPMTVQQFWQQAGPGTFLLLTKSEHQQGNVATCHVTVIRQGVLDKYSEKLLDTPLISIQQVLN